jgi:hypothetical protein
MALSPLHSSQYLVSTTKPIQRVDGADWGASLKSSVGSLTFTAAGTGTAKMVTLPAGRKIIFPDLCRIVAPQGSTNADLHVGHSAYVEPDGDTVSADDNAFADNLDLGGAALDQAFALPAVGYYVIDSKGPVDIEVLIDTANSAAAGEMFLLVVWAAVGK